MVGKYDGLNDDPARYSLPRYQIGYWAVKIVTGVPEAIPKYAFICYIRNSQPNVSLFQPPCKPHTKDRLVRLKRIFSMIRPDDVVYK
ncbi:hypothetical protein GOBAR_DD14995 [Gossypium barbadense]|nr:hypothetical protein GOBAR_DD14995 [Gossypium barbadense]